MKILLIAPPLLARFTSVSTLPPLGLASIAAVLEKNGFETRIIDVSAEEASENDIITEVGNYRPDIIGISSTTPAYPFAKGIMKRIKEEFPENLVVIGGVHPTFMPEQALQDGFDFAFKGEGEHTFLRFCQEYDRTRNRDGMQAGTQTDPIENLDELPFPAYHLLPFQKYQKFMPPSISRRKPWVAYCSSRGCPFGCIFCSVTKFWGNVWRGHSPKRMADDIERLIKEYKIRSVNFVDDNFTFNRGRILEFCRLVKERGMRFEWSCSCRVDQVDEELLKEMKSAGCWRIGFGVESGDPEVLKWYGKGITVEKARIAFKLCKETGISVFGFFIMGAPPETEESLKMTLKLALELDPDIMGLGFLTPFPGSRLWCYVQENSLLLEKNLDSFDQVYPVIKTGIPPEKLIEYSKKMYHDFYYRPSYVLRQVRRNLRDPRMLAHGVKAIVNRVRIKG